MNQPFPSRSANDPLLQPFTLKHLTFKNRIMSTSHACGLAEEGLPKDRYQSYHEEKARGGLALTMFGGSSNVAVDSAWNFAQINVHDDRIVDHFQAFARRIHAPRMSTDVSNHASRWARRSGRRSLLAADWAVTGSRDAASCVRPGDG